MVTVAQETQEELHPQAIPGALRSPDRKFASRRPQLSLIIPAHNEESTIAHTLAEYIAFLEGRAIHHEIWVIMNGCCDATAERVEACRRWYPQIGWAILTGPGKGRAVKLGLQLARGELIGFVDADGQIRPQEFAKLLNQLEHDAETDGAIASKYAESIGSARVSFVRRWMGHAFSKLVRWTLRLPFVDTQCGAKLFRRQVVHEILPQLQLVGWTFDVELLLHLCQGGCHIVEIPIALRPQGRPSQLSCLKVAPRMFLEVLRLRWARLQPQRTTHPVRRWRFLANLKTLLG